MSLIQAILVTMIALSSPLALAGEDSGCLLTQEDFWDVALATSVQVSYEGPFVGTSQGAEGTLYLRDDFSPALATIRYAGETGRAEARFLFGDSGLFVTWIDEDYKESIYEDPDPQVIAIRSACYLHGGDGIETILGEADDELVFSLIEDLKVLVKEHLPPCFDIPSF